MINLVQAKRYSLILSTIGFIFCFIFSSGYILGIFQLEHLQESKLVANFATTYGPFNYYDMPIRICLIATCFLLLTLINWLTQNTIFKTIGLLLLIVTLLQSYVVIRDPILAILFEEGNYAIKPTTLFVCLDFVIIALTILLITLQFLLIWKAKTSKDLSSFD